NLKRRQRCGRCTLFGTGNARYLERNVVVRAGEFDDLRLVVVLAGKGFDRKGGRRIVERVVARYALACKVVAVGKSYPAEAARGDIGDVPMVRSAQAYDAVRSGPEFRQPRDTGIHLLLREHAVCNTLVLRIENIHLDPTYLVAENLGLSIALI